MSSIDSTPHNPRSRSRRRLAAWLAFGVVGLAMGAVWATGFATIGGSGTLTTDPAIVVPTDPVDHTANLNTAVHPDATLVYNFAGYWGSVATTNLFTVDLSSEDAANKYNVGVLLKNGPALSVASGWATIQLKFEVVAAADGTTCKASDLNGTPHATKVMAFDSVDAGVYFNTLDGDTVWCVGVAASDGQDLSGTFLRAADDKTAPAKFPAFIATADRAS